MLFILMYEFKLVHIFKYFLERVGVRVVVALLVLGF